MGRRGPKRTPTAIARLKNFPGKRKKTREPEPTQAPADARRPPSWLSPMARAEWERLEPELSRLGLLTVLDLGSFAMFCAWYGRWREGEAQLERLVIRKRTGLLKVHPLVAVVKTAAEMTAKLAAQFGLTPSARTGLVGLPLDPTQPKPKPTPAAGDEFDSFLRQVRRDDA